MSIDTSLTDPAPALPPPPVAQVPGYRLGRKLGGGAMGTVHAAQREADQREVALKLLHMEHVFEPTLVRRFLTEACAIASIAHENVVALLDCGQTASGGWYLAMELVDGEGLRALLDAQAGRPLPLGRALAIGAQIADAVAATHAQGIVHRDLKPDNVMVRSVAGGDHVKLLDFGVAKMAQSAVSRLTLHGAIVGTPAYMAPEVVTDAASAGPEADVYALGCILYEMCTGARPFSAGGYEVLLQQVHEAAPSPRTLNPDLPVWLEQLILRALAKEPGQRPSMAELATGLRPLAGERRARERRAPPPFAPIQFQPILFDPAAAPGKTPASPPPAEPPVRRVARVAATALALMAALVLGSMWRVQRGAGQATRVSIESVPAGATVYEREVVLGTTPLVLVRQPGSSIRELRLEHQGYQSLVLSVGGDGNVRASVRLNPQLRSEARLEPAPSASRHEHRRERRDTPHADPKNGLLRVDF